MNPVEIGTGKSFKGLAAYLLHDPNRAQTSERVGWAQSFNLDDADPNRAWRLMAATAMSADQLKEAAGIKKGKPAKNTAYHLALSFNPDDDPSEDIQRAAVTGALQALGLQDYQALAISHTDTDHLHVHVMVNLINPENGLSAASKQPDGRAAPLSYAQKKLSAWAQAFEREHGLKVTEGRLENANKRAQGEKVNAQRDPRNVYERKKSETQDRRRDFVKRQFEDKARDLTAEGRDMHERHSAEWTALKSSYGIEKGALWSAQQGAFKQMLADYKEANKPRWRDLFARHRSEMRTFEMGERSAIGRIWHAAAVFHDRAIAGDALGGFVAAFSQQARRDIVQRKHDREREKLNKQIRMETEQRIRLLRIEQERQRAAARLRYIDQCNRLKLEQGEEKQEQRERWKEHNARRANALAPDRARVQGLSRDVSQGRGRGMEPS